jgi:hypothetical protein
VNPNVKTITRVGRSMWMYSGLMFVGIALSIAILFLTIWPRPIAIDAIAFFVGVPLVLGVISMCVRVGVILDLQRRTFSTWWGLLVPFYKSDHPLPKFNYVTVSFGTRSTMNNYSIRYRVYPVRLEGPGTNATTIDEPDDHDKANLLAEDIARFLHLGILDRSLGWDVVREASTLDLPLRE